MSLPTKREFLSANTDPATGKPFATPGRGRFSAAAEAFAAANVGKFADAVKAAPKPKAPKPAAAQGPRPAENGAVRAAAALAKREAKAAAKADKPKISQVRAEAPSPLDMPRRKQTVAYVVDPSIGKGGTLLAITSCARADKGGCGKAVNRCTHDAPLAPHYLPDGVALRPMSLVKPVV